MASRIPDQSSYDTPSAHQQPSDNKPAKSEYQKQIPWYLRNKTAGSSLTPKDYMHITLKNDEGISWIFRSIKIYFAKDTDQQKWAERGKGIYQEITSNKSNFTVSPSPTSSDSHLSKETSTISGLARHTLHLDETLSNTGNTQTSTVGDTRSETLSKLTYLRGHQQILQKIFPTIKLESLTKEEQNSLVSLLETIEQEPNLSEQALLTKTAKEFFRNTTPSSSKEVGNVLDAFKHLSAFRKEVGDATFSASNWKGELRQLQPGQVVDQSFINQLKGRLGWTDCLDRLKGYSVKDQEKFDTLLLTPLKSGIEGEKAPFDPNGDKEQALLSLLSACEEFPGFLDRAIEKLEEGKEDWTSQLTASFLGQPKQIKQLTEEIQNEYRSKGVEDYKQQFDPSLSPLIDSYLEAKFSGGLPKSSELPEAKSLPQKLFAFEMGKNSGLLSSDAITDGACRSAFEKDLSNFLPRENSHVSSDQLKAVTATHIQTLSTIAKMGNALISEHGYKPEEVSLGCVFYINDKLRNNPPLTPPQSEEQLNRILFKKLSAKEGWQGELKQMEQSEGLFSREVSSQQIDQEIASKLVPLLERHALKPINAQEVAELKALVEIATDLHLEAKYPIDAIVSGLVQYLGDARKEDRYFLAPHQGLSALNQAVISPYCQKNLSPQDFLAFELGKDSSLLASDGITDPASLSAFGEVFTPFVTGLRGETEVIKEQEQALVQTAKMANTLVTSQGYDAKEVAEGCKLYFEDLQKKNQLLKAPENEEALNPFLLKTLSGIARWEGELTQTGTQAIAQEFVAQLEQKGLKPVNAQEVAELKSLIEIASDINLEKKYSPEAIVAGLIDYLGEARAENHLFLAPHLGLSSLNQEVIIPYCYKHLTPLAGWEKSLQDRTPANQRPFLQAFLTEIEQHPNLGPFNVDELEALENMISLGADIARERENGYDSVDVAAGCVIYLEGMRSERKSFVELTSLGGLITNVSKGDLYPFCFNGLVQNLLKGNPNGKAINAFFAANEPIHGKGVPLTAEGKKRLGSLLERMGDPAFAQGQGIQHRAMAGKLPTILFDLSLSSLEEFNQSTLPPERISVLFDKVQEELFLLPSIHEVIDEVNTNPVEAAKSLMHAVVSTLTANPNKSKEVSQHLDQLVDDLSAKDPKGTLALMKGQLNKLMGRLQLSESAEASVSVNTSAILDILRNELKSIRVPAKNNQEINDILSGVQKNLEENKVVKDYVLLQKDKAQKQKADELKAKINELVPSDDKKAFEKAKKTNPEVKRLVEEFNSIAKKIRGREKEIAKIPEEQLTSHPRALRYQKFIAIRDQALRTDLSKEAKDALVQEIESFLVELSEDQPVEAKKKGFLSSVMGKKTTAPSIQQSLEQLPEKLNKPRVMNEENLHQYGIMGEAIQGGVNTLASIQEARNQGTYDNEEGLKEIAGQLKLLEGWLPKLAIGAVLFSPKAVEKGMIFGINFAMNRQISKVKKQQESARKAGDTEEVASIQAKLNALQAIKDNREEIGKALVPLAVVLLKHHDLQKHQQTIKTLRKLLEDPKKELTENDRAALASQLALSADILVAEIQKHYPTFLENITDALFNLPRQGQQAPASKPAVFTPKAGVPTEQETKNFEASKIAFQNKLLEDFPLQGEDDAKKTGGFGGFFQSARMAVTDYTRNQEVRVLASSLGRQLAFHPFFTAPFNEDQHKELFSLLKEAETFQKESGYPPQVVARACRLYIEAELEGKGKLDIPMIPRRNEPSVQERLMSLSLQATIEEAVLQSAHPQREDPYLAQTVAILISQQMIPSQELLTETGRNNIAALTAVLLDPDFAGGKPLDLPVVTKQFKYLFPSDLNTVASLNGRPIPAETLATMKMKSQKLVQRGINLGLLQEGFTQSPEGALNLLFTPLVDILVPDRSQSATVKQGISFFIGELGQTDQMSWAKEKMNTSLEKLGILKAVQIDVSISTRQATTRLGEETERLQLFMEKEGRIPSPEEAEKIGVMTPQLVNLVKAITSVKDVQNGTAPPLKEDDARVGLLSALPRVSARLRTVRPFLGMIQKIPGFLSLLEGVIPSILKWVIEDQIKTIQAKNPLTETDQATIQFLEHLLQKDNMERLTKIALPLVNSILLRHDLTRHGNLIDLLIKIGDPDNKNGVDEVELMKALLVSAGVVLDEVNTHYGEAIPDLLNAVKAIQFLGSF